jgi:TRAP-type C4-dicarboxylate transport system substrate-binding protein
MDKIPTQQSLTMGELSFVDEGVSDYEGQHNDVGILDKGYTLRDRNDMQRLGKKQELIRNFRPLSALAFTVLLQATWEYILVYVPRSFRQFY